MKSLSTNRAVQRTAAVVGGAALLFMSLPVAAAHATSSDPTSSPGASVAITGTLKVGGKVKATNLVLPDETATVSYSWKLCETATSTTCTDASLTTQEITVPTGAATKYLKVIASGTSQSAVATSTEAVAKADQSAGSVTVAASGTGSLVAPVANTLSVSSGAIARSGGVILTPSLTGFGVNGAGFEATYEWFADGSPIAPAVLSGSNVTPNDGAVDSSTGAYWPTDTVVGKVLTVKVTSTKDGYNNATATSAATGPVVSGTVSAGTLTVGGKSNWDGTTWQVGTALTAATSDQTSGADLWYQWFSGSTLVGTGNTYTPTVADQGNKIRVKLTATKTRMTPASVSLPAESTQLGAQVPGPLSITGTAGVGETLTASTAAIGASDWANGSTLSYQWYRKRASGGFVAISGETGKTYSVSSGDLGYTMAVGVTATKAGYTAADNFAVASSAVMASQVAGDITVTNDDPFKQAVVGAKLTVSVKKAADNTTPAAGEWVNDGSISAELVVDGKVTTTTVTLTGSNGVHTGTYTLAVADWNKKISFQVTNGGYTAGSVTYAAVSKTSAEFGPVLRKQAALSAPTLVVPAAGAKVGQTLTATPAAAAPAGVTYVYQWLRTKSSATTVIEGEAEKTYVLTAADLDSTISVKTIAKQSGYGDAISTSASDPTKAVAKGDFAGTVSVAGVPTPGKALSVATTGFPKGSKLTYQWYQTDADGISSEIAGATSKSYTVATADLGAKLTVEVTASADGYNTKVMEAESAIVSKTVTSTVKVSFTSSKSSTLKASSKSALSNKVELAGSGLTKLQVTGYGKTSSIAKARAAAIVKYLKSEGVTSVSSSYKKSSSSSKAVFTYVTTN